MIGVPLPSAVILIVSAGTLSPWMRKGELALAAPASARSATSNESSSAIVDHE